jgi:hypothetical protein
VLWFTVWSLLVIGTLAGAFFLVREVYRSAKALLVELERLTEVLDRIAERSAELVATATTPAPVDLLDPAPARARLAEARLATLRRRARKADRHAEAYRRWQAFTR